MRHTDRTANRCVAEWRIKQRKPFDVGTSLVYGL